MSGMRGDDDEHPANNRAGKESVACGRTFGEKVYIVI